MKTKYFKSTINRAKVAIYPLKGVQSFMIRADFRAGSWYETGPKWGAMHLLEHLTLDGTQNLPSELKVEKYKEKYGIRVGATTSGPKIEYQFEAPFNNLKPTLYLLEEIIFRPQLASKDFAREIKVIVQEFTDKWSDPYNRFWKASREHLVGKAHPYSRDGMGQPDFLKTLKVTDLQSVHQKHFTPSNLYLSVAGKVNPQRFKSQLASILANQPKGLQRKAKFPPIKSQRKMLWHPEDLDQIMYCQVWLTPGDQQLSLKQRFTLNIIKYLLGGSARSKLFKELRMKKGLVYKTGASLFFSPTYGEFEIWSSTSRANLTKVSQIMTNVISSFTSSLTQTEFVQARNYMNMRTFMIFDSTASISNIVVNDLFYEGRFYPPEERVRIANSISFKYLKSQFEKYILSAKSHTLIMAREKPPLH